ncbi:hypothetical protein [Marinicella meishanensis]|uniref:hypothetical protein n=1 Tax=Marinicella meishanensis TaxID=2873263 RepID=UPI001CC06B46|nr:hypothetical protein [Marinicella sp. NBU2979]
MSFTAQMAQFFDEMGQGSMTGRIFGHLLICQPAKQRAKAIQQATGASAGAVHGALKTFVAAGLVNRNSEAGSKTMWYEIADDAFLTMLTARLAMIKKLVQLADLGLAEMPSGADTQRLEAMRSCYAHFEQRFPAMIAEFKAQKERHE